MADESFKRKLTAILSADVIGYSLLMRDDEEATVRNIAAHRVLISDIIQQHHGRVVDSPGDNILAEFASVVNAVNGAIKIQQEIKKNNKDTAEDRRMEFRIGINLGDVIEEEERIYGDGVNIAARVEGLAAAGGISISGTVYEHIKDKLSLGYHFLGEQNVKNIPEPVRIYRLLTEAEDAGKIIDEGKPESKKLRYVTYSALAVVILVVGALIIWNNYFRFQIEPASVKKMAYPLPDKPSIAVLPFVNMSEDKEQDYFCDGITEEIITALSRTPKMFVIASNSSFSYKDKAVKVKQVAEELGVQYVLEGSVRKSGDRVRITAQLINALTGGHLWAERYDRYLKDIFALQDEITIKIISALQVKLTDGEIARIRAKGTQNLEAYLKVLHARESFFTVTKEGMATTRRLCEEAIALDPNYAAAYGFTGSTHWMDFLLGSSESSKESLKLAFEFLEKAKALNNNLPSSQLGYLYFVTRQYDKGIAECERAVSLEPNSGRAHIWMSLVLMLVGKHENAVRHAEQALRLDPLAKGWYFRILGQAYAWVGRYNRAITALKKSQQQAPNDIFSHLSLTVAYSWAGRQEEARNQAAEVLRINPKYNIKKAARAAPFKNEDDLERYKDGLRKAGLPE
jgi:adenylate cyclase